MRLSIVILTWNEKAEITRCLDSLMPWVATNDEVIVVDNGSTDGTEDSVRRMWPMIRYHRLDKNIGVGPARNFGAGKATGKWLMTLDNDTVFRGPTPGPVIESFYARTADAGIMSFRLRNEDGTIQRSVRRFPPLWQPFCARAPFSRLPAAQRVQHRHLMLDLDLECVDEPLAVDYMIGANHIVSMELFQRLGGYDENMFYGAEDCELCLRAKQAGKRNYFVPGATVDHLHKRRSRYSLVLAARHFFSFYYMYYKHRRIWSLFP